MDIGGRPKNVVWNDFFCVKKEKLVKIQKNVDTLWPVELTE